MKSINLAKKLEGLCTLEMAAKKLKVKRSTAVKIISMLRKEGFIKTTGGGKQPRLYRISPLRITGKEYLGLYDIINRYSKVKIYGPYEHKVVDRRLTIEEAVPMAVKEGNVRIALASLGLFNFVKNWPRLNMYAKKYKVQRKVGALYDAARTCIRVKRMDEKTRRSLLKGKDKDKFIVKPLKSKDFKALEKRWNVLIPFNRADLERYKE